MTEIELQSLKKGIIVTAAYYNRDISGDVVAMMASDLADLPYDRVSEAFKTYRLNPKNKTFPMPAQIREVVSPEPTEDHVGRELSARILEAITRFGYPNGQEAREYVGEIGWSVVRAYGGWSTLCQNMGTLISQDQFVAQSRELIKGRVAHGGNFGENLSQLDFAPKPELEISNLINIKSLNAPKKEGA